MSATAMNELLNAINKLHTDPDAGEWPKDISDIEGMPYVDELV